jgi:hypothetical protein
MAEDDAGVVRADELISTWIDDPPGHVIHRRDLTDLSEPYLSTVRAKRRLIAGFLKGPNRP